MGAISKKLIYAINLYSKYTGERISLGTKFNSLREAKEETKNICSKCNRIKIIEIPKEAVWINKDKGFVLPNINYNFLSQ